MPDISRKLFFIFLFTLAILGAWARWHYLCEKSMWADEIIVARISKLDTFSDMLFAARRDVNGPSPLDHALHWYAYKQFKSEKVFYALPLIFSTLTIIITALVGASLGSRILGIISAILLFFNPLETDMSLYARFYCHFQFWAMVGVYFYIRCLLSEKKDYFSWFFYMISRLLAIYTTQLALILIVSEISALFLILLWGSIKQGMIYFMEFSAKRQMHNLAACIAANVIVVVAFLPWILSFPVKKNFGYQCQYNAAEVVIHIIRDLLANWIGGSFLILSPILFFLIIIILIIFVVKKILPQIYIIILLWALIHILIVAAAIIRLNFFYVPRLVFPVVPMLILIEAAIILNLANGVKKNKIEETKPTKNIPFKIINLWMKIPVIIRLIFLLGIFISIGIPSLRRIVNDDKACWKKLAEFVNTKCPNPEQDIILSPDINVAGFAMYYLKLIPENKQDIWVDYYKWADTFKKFSPKYIWYFTRTSLKEYLPFEVETYVFPGYWEGGVLHKIKEPVDKAGDFNYRLYYLVKSEIEHAERGVSANTYSTFSTILFFGGKYDESIKYIDIALKENPDNPSWLLIKALNYIALEKPSVAQKLLIHAFDIEPEHGEVVRYLIRLNFKIKSELQFITIVKTIMQKIKGVQPLTQAGKTLLELEYYDLALECFERLLKLDPVNPWHSFFLGATLCKMHRFDEGLNKISQAIKAAANHPYFKSDSTNKDILFFQEQYEIFKKQREAYAQGSTDNKK